MKELVKKDMAVFGDARNRLVFDLMKKFPIGPGNMSVILTMEEAAATIVVMQEEIAAHEKLKGDRDRVVAERDALKKALTQITNIENEMYGRDWDEIERAMVVAREALAKLKGEV